MSVARWGPPGGCSSRFDWSVLTRPVDQEEHVKSYEEVMEILEAFDLTGSYRDAAELAGCSHHTVADWVAKREPGRVADRRARSVERPKLIDRSWPKIEEWVERSDGKIRADVVFDKLVAARVRRLGPHGAPGGGPGEGQLPAGPPAGVSAVDPRAGHVGPVGLGSGPDDRRRGHEPVLRLVGVVTVPGRDPDLGPHDADGDRLPRPGDARLRWGADVLADRQREDRDASITSPGSRCATR